MLRLDAPPALRPRCAIGTPGVCTSQPRNLPADCVDHVLPLSRGGAKYDVSNCRPACAACNGHRNRELAAALDYEPPTRRVSSW